MTQRVFDQLELVDSQGHTLANLLVSDEGGWFSGRVLSQSFPSEVAKDLAWYDEVVQHQMLSYLDEAMAAVARWGLRVQFRDGSTYPTYALHVGLPDEVSFRVTPVPSSPDSGAMTSQQVGG
jgi:hypothetical protein